MDILSGKGETMAAHDQMKKFLEERPELAQALRVFQVSSESYVKAMEAINPVVRYTSTSTRAPERKPRR